MQKEDIEKIIEAMKKDQNMSKIFGKRIVYNSFYNDEQIDKIGLIMTPFESNSIKCLERELVQFQIIDGKDSSTNLEMKGYMDIVCNFLNSFMKDFKGFKTIRIHENGDGVLLKNNKERLVFTKRFIFYY